MQLKNPQNVVTSGWWSNNRWSTDFLSVKELFWVYINSNSNNMKFSRDIC